MCDPAIKRFLWNLEQDKFQDVVEEIAAEFEMEELQRAKAKLRGELDGLDTLIGDTSVSSTHENLSVSRHICDPLDLINRRSKERLIEDLCKLYQFSTGDRKKFPDKILRRSSFAPVLEWRVLQTSSLTPVEEKECTKVDADDQTEVSKTLSTGNVSNEVTGKEQESQHENTENGDSRMPRESEGDTPTTGTKEDEYVQQGVETRVDERRMSNDDSSFGLLLLEEGISIINECSDDDIGKPSKMDENENAPTPSDHIPRDPVLAPNSGKGYNIMAANPSERTVDLHMSGQLPTSPPKGPSGGKVAAHVSPCDTPTLPRGEVLPTTSGQIAVEKSKSVLLCDFQVKGDVSCVQPSNKKGVSKSRDMATQTEALGIRDRPVTRAELERLADFVDSGMADLGRRVRASENRHTRCENRIESLEAANNENFKCVFDSQDRIIEDLQSLSSIMKDVVDNAARNDAQMHGAQVNTSPNVQGGASCISTPIPGILPASNIAGPTSAKAAIEPLYDSICDVPEKDSRAPVKPNTLTRAEKEKDMTGWCNVRQRPKERERGGESTYGSILRAAKMLLPAPPKPSAEKNCNNEAVTSGNQPDKGDEGDKMTGAGRAQGASAVCAGGAPPGKP